MKPSWNCHNKFQTWENQLLSTAFNVSEGRKSCEVEMENSLELSSKAHIVAQKYADNIKLNFRTNYTSLFTSF